MKGPTSHSIEAERSILGALLRDPRRVLELVELPEPAAFYVPQHMRIARAAMELIAANKPIDPVSIADQLGAHLPSVGYEGLAELASGPYLAENVGHYVAIIRDHALKRRVCIAASNVLACCDNEHDSGEDAHGELLRQASMVDGPEQQDKATMVEALVAETIVRITAPGPCKVRSVLTGYADVDDTTGGLARGAVTILAGRPSQGKSALARSFAMHAAQRGEGVHVFSLEDSKDRYGDRCVADLAGVDLGKFSAQKPNLDDEELWNIRNAVVQVRDWPLLIDDAAGLSSQQVANRVRQRHRTLKTALVVVDYVQLMHERGARDKRDEVDRAAEGMVRLARENDVAVLLLSQLSRENEKRLDKKPVLSDLRESGTLEQVADAVFMVHQDWTYLDPDSSDPKEQAAYRKAFGVADLLVRKNKHGRRGDLKLRWIGKTATYEPARLADSYGR